MKRRCILGLQINCLTEILFSSRAVVVTKMEDFGKLVTKKDGKLFIDLVMRPVSAALKRTPIGQDPR